MSLTTALNCRRTSHSEGDRQDEQRAKALNSLLHLSVCCSPVFFSTDDFRRDVGPYCFSGGKATLRLLSSSLAILQKVTEAEVMLQHVRGRTLGFFGARAVVVDGVWGGGGGGG